VIAQVSPLEDDQDGRFNHRLCVFRKIAKVAGAPSEFGQHVPEPMIGLSIAGGPVR